jgi:type IV secretion system protein VirB8
VVFKRSQKDVSESSKHWYQDKYQHVLVQRNIFALIAICSLGAALIAVLAVARLAPLKSVEPYLLQVDEKTGITQKVEPLSRNEYAASEAIDRYFTSMYIRVRESYNFSILRYNYSIAQVMSAPNVFNNFRRAVDPSNPQSLAATLGTQGTRDVKIRSIAYIKNPPIPNEKTEETPEKIIQARITTTDMMPNSAIVVQQWVVTINFEYASLDLNEENQLLNPLGYYVTSYQIQREIN